MADTNIELVYRLMGGFFLAIGILHAVVMLVAHRQAKRVRRDAGQLLIAPVRLAYRRSNGSPLLGAFVLCYVMGIGLRFGVIGFLISIAIVLLWLPLVFWGTSVNGGGYCQLRDKGIILGGTNLTPWSMIRRYRWAGSDPVRLKLYLSRAFVDLPLGDDDQREVQRVLSARLANHVETATV